jgi:hypothetical protein
MNSNNNTSMDSNNNTSMDSNNNTRMDSNNNTRMDSNTHMDSNNNTNELEKIEAEKLEEMMDSAKGVVFPPGFDNKVMGQNLAHLINLDINSIYKELEFLFSLRTFPNIILLKFELNMKIEYEIGKMKDMLESCANDIYDSAHASKWCWLINKLIKKNPESRNMFREKSMIDSLVKITRYIEFCDLHFLKDLLEIVVIDNPEFYNSFETEEFRDALMSNLSFDQKDYDPISKLFEILAIVCDSKERISELYCTDKYIDFMIDITSKIDEKTILIDIINHLNCFLEKKYINQLPINTKINMQKIFVNYVNIYFDKNSKSMIEDVKKVNPFQLNMDKLATLNSYFVGDPSEVKEIILQTLLRQSNEINMTMCDFFQKVYVCGGKLDDMYQNDEMYESIRKMCLEVPGCGLEVYCD